MKYVNLREEELKNLVAKDFFDGYDCSAIIKDIDFAVREVMDATRIPPHLDTPHILPPLEDTSISPPHLEDISISPPHLEDISISPPHLEGVGGGFIASELAPLPSEADSEHPEYFLWAEAKSTKSDIVGMMTQLILTIGKARTYDKIQPPPFLGCFDNCRIVFVPYYEIQEIFYQSDFNWNVAPSNPATKEFRQVYELIERLNGHKTFLFDFEKDEKELKAFVKDNFVAGRHGTSKIKITKNNFKWIYDKWVDDVKPSIQLFASWDDLKNDGIIDADFYLADLLSMENKTLKGKLFVLLNETKYILDRHISQRGLLTFSEVEFSDAQKAHIRFWAKYERPPLREYWDYIIDRRDLLVSQDVRERKGSFYTPKQWVELSQKYLADVFGVDWQDEYYIWDCAAGTGNLLAGLTNKYQIWASTLDKADVDVMHDRIDNGATLLHDHVFQFDFLNDDFKKLPESLKKIIFDEKKRRKLIIYINPPYVEAATANRQGNKIGVSKSSKKEEYKQKIGNASNEIFAQFLVRIYSEIRGCYIGEFSKLKSLTAPNFKKFRQYFLVELKKCFIIPANTFDNVKGKFPIGFKIWDTQKGKHFESTEVDIYDSAGAYSGKKLYADGIDCRYINEWYKNYYVPKGLEIGILNTRGNDFQNQNYIYISTENNFNHTSIITKENLMQACVYFAVRKCIKSNWLNDRDQFLYPNDEWETDYEFQTDCLAFTLFHSSNNIRSQFGENHWIPFREDEVNARTRFDSHFMTDFMAGKISRSLQGGIRGDGNGVLNFDVTEMSLSPNVAENSVHNFCPPPAPSKGGGISVPLQFSDRAKEVFRAGREIWEHYHNSPSFGGGRGREKNDITIQNYNPNASFYDIREFFQGRNASGKMNNDSDDEIYKNLLAELKLEMIFLGKQIEPKIYRYGFLKS